MVSGFIQDLVHSAHHLGGVAITACAGCIAQHRSAPAAVAHRQAIRLWTDVPPAGACRHISIAAMSRLATEQLRRHVNAMMTLLRSIFTGG